MPISTRDCALWQRLGWLTGIFILLATPYGRAHQEPAKTQRELSDLQRASERTRMARHKRCVSFSYPVVEGTPGDQRSQEFIMEFDLDGRLSSISAWKDGHKVESAEYAYDPSGNMRKETDQAQGKTETTVFRLDAEGLVLGGETFDETGQPSESFSWEVAADGRRLVFTKRDADGRLQYRIEYRYVRHFDDEDFSNAIKKGPDGRVMQRVEQTIVDSRVVEKRIFIEDRLAAEFGFVYASNGRIAEAVKRVGGKVESRTVYGFDSFGNISEVRTFDESNILKAYSKIECEMYEPIPR